MAKKVFIIIYSMYGHMLKLAESVKKGLEAQGIEATIYQVEETLPEEVLTKMYASKLDLPIMDPRGDDFIGADGYVFGIPTRHGTMPAQMKTFWDATGGHWAKGSLVGKPYTLMTSTSTQHGGQETTALASIPVMTHHAMVYVPIGFTHPNLSEIEEAVGGTPYGAATFTGPTGARMPSAKELEIAEHQGGHFGKFINRLN